MRFASIILVLLALAACTPATESADQGAGFESYAEYQRRREAQLMAEQSARPVAPIVPRVADAPARPVVPATPARPAAPGPTVAAAAPEAPTNPVDPGDPVDPVDPLNAMNPGTDGAAPDNAGISDENEFAAVSARESIESDKARIAANREKYTEVAPTAVPDRPAGTGSAIVDFALSTTNAVGQPIHSRSKVSLASNQRACAKFPSSDKAQEAFLKRGGPKRDGGNLDPDGDGFACSWDPAPFRTARGG